MWNKIFLSLSFFSLFFATSAFAHGAEEEVKKSYDGYLYVALGLYALAIAGFVYYYIVDRKIKKVNSKTKEGRKTINELNQKAIKFLKYSSSILVIAFITNMIFAYLDEPLSDKGVNKFDHNIDLKVEKFDAKSIVHVEPGKEVEYTHYPPTIGDHYASELPYGFYSEEQPPYELLVHNLEHGDIVIYYNSKVSEEIEEHLKEMSKAVKKGSGVIVVKDNNLKNEEIVVTAWGKRIVQEKFNEKVIEQFIYDNIFEGPEKFPDRTFNMGK